MDAIAQLYAEHHATAVRLAHLVTGDAEQAEDVVAEVFAKIARNRPALAHPVAYLRRAVTNEAYSSWRRRTRDTERLRRHAAQVQAEVPDPAEGNAERDRMWAALLRLPVRQRTALVLRYYEDLSELDIAAAMGVSVGTVKSTTARALLALRTQLAADAIPASELVAAA